VEGLLINKNMNATTTTTTTTTTTMISRRRSSTHHRHRRSSAPFSDTFVRIRMDIVNTTDGRTTWARVVRNASPATTKNTKETINITLRVEGMMCEGCAETVESALKKSEDVEDVTVDLQTKIVIVKVAADRVKSQVEAMGKIPEFVKMVTESGFDCEPVF